MPTLIRGLSFEGWHPGDKPLRERDRDTFLVRVHHDLHPGFDAPNVDLEVVCK